MRAIIIALALLVSRTEAKEWEMRLEATECGAYRGDFSADGFQGRLVGVGRVSCRLVESVGGWCGLGVANPGKDITKVDQFWVNFTGRNGEIVAEGQRADDPDKMLQIGCVVGGVSEFRYFSQERLIGMRCVATCRFHEIVKKPSKEAPKAPTSNKKKGEHSA